MHNTKMSNTSVNAEADALAARAAGGYMRWYDGVQPATGDTDITTQSVVAELRFGTPAFGASINGVIAATAITPDPAAAGGTATWFRNFEADGTTPLWDGNIGTIGSDSDIELNSVIIPPGVIARHRQDHPARYCRDPPGGAGVVRPRPHQPARRRRNRPGRAVGFRHRDRRDVQRRRTPRLHGSGAERRRPGVGRRQTSPAQRGQKCRGPNVI